MLCEVCEAEEATVTLIPIGEGMPQSVGGACFARFGLEAAKTILPAEEVAAILGPLFVQPASAAKPAKAPKRAEAEAAPEKPEPVEGPPDASPPAEEPPAAEVG